MRITVPELAAKYVYPALRRRLVEILYREEKMSQKEIARQLGITQSAVSRYVEGSRGSHIDVSKYRDIEEELRYLAHRISNREIDVYGIQLELSRITMVFLGKGYACSLHSRLDMNVDPSKCKSCLILFKHYIR